MNKLAALAVAGLATSASAQTTLDIVVDLTDASAATIVAFNNNEDGVGLDTPLETIIATLSGDGVIDLTLNPAFQNILTGEPVTDNGTSSVGINAANNSFFSGDDFDPSNPIEVGTFSYTGSLAAFSFEVEAATFFIDSTPLPVGASFDGINVTIIPAPATAGLLGLGGLVAARRRRA